MATRIKLSQYQSIPDALSSDGFRLDLGTIPNGIGNDERLSIKCMNASYPGSTNEAFQAVLHGHTRNFRGRKTFPGRLAVTYIEDAEMHTLTSLKRWDEYCAGTESGNSSGFIDEYGITAELAIFNTKGDQIDTVIFYRLFPVDIPDMPVDGSATQAFQVPITFSYDYHTSANVPVL